jgi:hypothetical protein
MKEKKKFVINGTVVASDFNEVSSQKFDYGFMRERKPRDQLFLTVFGHSLLPLSKSINISGRK